MRPSRPTTRLTHEKMLHILDAAAPHGLLDGLPARPALSCCVSRSRELEKNFQRI